MTRRQLRWRQASLVPATVLMILALAGCGGDDEPAPRLQEPTDTERRTDGGRDSGGDGAERLARSTGAPRAETYVTGLEIPWEIVFLPDGRALVTERPGRVRVISAEGELESRPATQIDVAAVGEGGLLGLALDPDFPQNDLVYGYYTTESGSEVARYRLEGGRLREEAVVLDGIAAAAIHDGGRLGFGPDDRLYITSGDAGQDSLARDPGSLNGKILRLDRSEYRGDGPGEADVFTLGHRNPQGLDWEPGTDRPIATEHGPDGDDEVNLLREGQDYGWPEVQGEDHGDFAAPLTVYEESIAPSGGTFVTLRGSAWTGDFLFGALVGEQIRRLGIDGGEVTRDQALFQGEFGRVRTVTEGPDGALYALTSNRDGRGSPREGDDRVIRIVPPEG